MILQMYHQMSINDFSERLVPHPKGFIKSKKKVAIKWKLVKLPQVNYKVPGAPQKKNMSLTK